MNYKGISLIVCCLYLHITGNNPIWFLCFFFFGYSLNSSYFLTIRICVLIQKGLPLNTRQYICCSYMFISDNFCFFIVFEYGNVCWWSLNKRKIKITWDNKLKTTYIYIYIYIYSIGYWINITVYLLLHLESFHYRMSGFYKQSLPANKHFVPRVISKPSMKGPLVEYIAFE